MSDEAGKAASTGHATEQDTAAEATLMSFAEFLESVPPGEMRRVKGLRYWETGGRSACLDTPPFIALFKRSLQRSSHFPALRGNTRATGYGYRRQDC
jgi:hypothetical protein